MERRPVISSNLKSVGYDTDSQMLEVEFHSGAVYQYYGVPQSLYEGLLNAPSHGKYFHRYIRNQFPYRRVK